MKCCIFYSFLGSTKIFICGSMLGHYFPSAATLEDRARGDSTWSTMLEAESLKSWEMPLKLLFL
ncbi:hypothetical protein BDV12DRAFT_168906 [Aspergillus spectabilis]